MNISKEEQERIEKNIDVWIREEYHDRTPNKTHVGIANMIASYRAGATHEHLYMMEKLADRWISVKDRLPEHEQNVMYWIGRPIIGKFFLNQGRNKPCFSSNPSGVKYVADGKVTHWMPLPEPPLNTPEPPKV